MDKNLLFVGDLEDVKIHDDGVVIPVPSEEKDEILSVFLSLEDMEGISKLFEKMKEG